MFILLVWGLGSLVYMLIMAGKAFVGSHWYWVRLPAEADGKRKGSAVVLGWMLSRRRHLQAYTCLFSSSGFDSLVCRPNLFNLFFATKAATLALSILEELVKDLEDELRPLVLVVFSGSHKACLYKMLQILHGSCPEMKVDKGRYDIVKKCLAGVIFDSSPMDFAFELGAKFAGSQIFSSGRPSALVSWGSYTAGKTLDLLFHNHFESERFELWETLNSVVSIGPILILCSESDELAPIDTIQKFASNIQRLGGNITLISWPQSEHVGHLRLHPEDYKGAVSKLLADAYCVFSTTHRGFENNQEMVGRAAHSSSSPSPNKPHKIAAASISETSFRPFHRFEGTTQSFASSNTLDYVEEPEDFYWNSNSFKRTAISTHNLIVPDALSKELKLGFCHFKRLCLLHSRL